MVISAWLRIYTGLHPALVGIDSTSISSTSDLSCSPRPSSFFKHYHRAVIMAVATQDLNVLERVVQTPKRGHVAVDKPPAVPSSIATITSASSVSTWLSPAGFDDIWDLPETPIKQMSNASLRGILTPLTPPTPPTTPRHPQPSRKLPTPPISKLSFLSEASPSTKQQLVDEKDVVVQDDTSQTPKLFRNLTFELQASKLQQCWSQ